MTDSLPFEGRPTLDGTTVAVYGLGKMGLPLSAVLADHGATVRGVDVDEAVVEAVNTGDSPVENEPGLSELVAEHAGDALTATTDGATAAADAEVMVALVPTVLDDDRNADLGPLLAVAADVRAGLAAGDLVVTESTVPPGTTAGPFADAVAPDHLEPGADFHLAHCPERTASGRVLRDLTESYPKVVGGVTPRATDAAASLYRTFNEPSVRRVSSATAAEAVKVFEGVYRDVNIALANELAKACERWGLQASEVFDAANGQPYCDIHDPGCGVGGHCIPVYPYFVADRAETPLVETARGVNEGMPAHAVALLEALLEDAGRDLSAARVLVLGVTYRPGVRETRYSPGVDVAEILDADGAEVFVHDPLLSADAIGNLGLAPVAAPDAVEDLDGVVLATGHEQYRSLDLAALAGRMRTPVLVDGRNFFDRKEVEALAYAAVGEGGPEHPRYSSAR